MKERSKIETDYALKLKRLVKTYSSKVDKKKHNENDEELTRAKAFRYKKISKTKTNIPTYFSFSEKFYLK